MSIKLHLVVPTLQLEEQFWNYINEWKTNNERVTPAASDPGDLNFMSWFDRQEKMKDVNTVPIGLVTCEQFFLTDNNSRILGTIDIRHQLNDYLFKYGGNIGYGIRPSERKKGYAKIMLELTLDKCKEKGMDKILITCLKDNIGSVKTITANHGVLENEVVENNQVKQRYWITLRG